MKGTALILALLVLSICSALGAALMLVTMPESLAAGAYLESVAALNAADAAMQLAVQELETIPDWNRVLSGDERSRYVDGPPGTRRIGRRADIDLNVLTSRLSCDQDAPCPDARIRRRTVERPWGTNNPRWTIFLHGQLSAIVDAPEFNGAYVVVWVGDDGREADGNPMVDGGGPLREGLSTVRLRADSYGPGTSHRAIEAEVFRRDRIQVQSWRSAVQLP